MNLYSNKQKWKIALLILALFLVGISLFVSNEIVSKVREREQERAQQWAETIQKKVELVQLTNSTFDELRDKERLKMELWINATKEVSSLSSNLYADQRDYEFPLSIIQKNTDIPVIVLDNNNMVSGNRNLEFDTSHLRQHFPDLSQSDLLRKFDDSLVALSKVWKQKNPSFSIEIFEGLVMTYVYDDSKVIQRLERERDTLINSFNNELIHNEGMVPVLLVNSEANEVIGTNINDFDTTQKPLSTYISEMKKENEPIQINLEDNTSNQLYFGESPELKQLRYFPYIQFLIIGLFIFIGYLIFSTFRKAEQNQVWAGMAKETAHQLGTPLSSLMAWVQLLESQDTDPMIIKEMQKDVLRLEKVTDRFSKIGSGATLREANLSETLGNLITYLRPRISDKVEISTQIPSEIITFHNPSLIEWVIENICNNAVDAMEAEGKLFVELKNEGTQVHIDIRDTGKGMPTNLHKRIFQPGFSTKKRGWGLGLSLVKRIVTEYHNGRVFVLESTPQKGTTFRISLPKHPKNAY